MVLLSLTDAWLEKESDTDVGLSIWRSFKTFFSDSILDEMA